MPYWVIPIIIGGAVLIIIVFVIIILVRKKNRRPIKPKIDEEYVNNLVDSYGGINNIKSVDVENGRLKINVNDLSVVNLEEIKSMAQGGVFVTGMIIKTLYRLDSKTIKDYIENMR